MTSTKQSCSRCVLDTGVPGISFNDRGECSYCQLHDRLDKQYPISSDLFAKCFYDIARNAKKGQKYDCLIGVSGGLDSSYMLYQAVVRGLKPLALHFDNGFDADVADRNIENLSAVLNVDTLRMGVRRDMYHRVCRSFLLASVSDADIPNDIAMLSMVMSVAKRFGIKYILNGHNFRTEGTCPVGWTVMDSKYLKSVHSAYDVSPIDDFPSYSIRDQFMWGLSGIRSIRPLYHVDFDADRVAQLLAAKVRWVPYGNKHCENIYTEFVGSYLLPIKFGINKRMLYYSALIRSGKMTRESALEKLKELPAFAAWKIAMIKSRLGITDEMFETIMNDERHYSTEFETNMEWFSKHRRLMRLGAKLGIFPQTFYEKYCKKPVS